MSELLELLFTFLIGVRFGISKSFSHFQQEYSMRTWGKSVTKGLVWVGVFSFS